MVLPPQRIRTEQLLVSRGKRKQQTTGAVTHVGGIHLRRYLGRGADAGNKANLLTWNHRLCCPIFIICSAELQFDSVSFDLWGKEVDPTDRLT